MEYKFRTLRADEIDCRVSTINDKGLSLLLYKDARVDMDVLDETVGAENWERDHKELKGNIYCGIGIWDEAKGRFIYKWDAGKESNTESEKGEASDSFKRAGFNWGIGRELYTAPFIYIKPLDSMANEFDGQKIPEFYKNKNNKFETKTKFEVNRIAYDKNKNITGLEIIDNKKNVRFTGGKLKDDDAQSLTRPNEETHEVKPKAQSGQAVNKTVNKTAPTITEEQIKIIKEKYTDEELAKLLPKVNKTKVEQLNVVEASKLIKLKEENNNVKNN